MEGKSGDSPLSDEVAEILLSSYQSTASEGPTWSEANEQAEVADLFVSRRSQKEARAAISLGFKLQYRRLTRRGSIRL
ncbi:hypothetical protein PoB_003514500 [Plakobranchus ocellatus]|uniref:Uncharacterized protein n=1 Tax=Plakobranchus ocellatus TaxID=259542 RepID=A0AAV4AP33_9GAST|nr:hypothetical protein PoB_003514500 [Plakobranchus ocellatus]